MAEIVIHDKIFVPFISRDAIRQRVMAMAGKINAEYAGRRPLLLGILNGSFIFAADLARELIIDTEITFVKLASYHGTTSTGNVVTAIGLKENVKGRDIIIVEDIVDSGKTMSAFLPELHKLEPASVKIAAFLTKPGALRYPIRIDYHAFEIEDKFVVGYGMDYDGSGRNLPDLYILKDS